MITTKFGVTVEFLRQLHYRMLREHVSFAGEADVARATASWSSTGDSLPKDLRKCLSKAWFFWRLSLRLEETTDALVVVAGAGSSHILPAVDLLKRVEAALLTVYPASEAHFENSTATKVRAAGLPIDVHVIDGNANKRRSVCAAALARKIECMRLKRSVRVCCPRTPLLGGKLCSEHGESAQTTDETCDYVVINHEKIKPFGPEPEQFRVLLRESGGTNREFWAEEHMVSSGVKHQTSSSRRQASDVKQQTSTSRRQAAGVKQQASISRRQSAGNKQQTSSSRRLAADV
jgi:hypothetical protein